MSVKNANFLHGNEFILTIDKFPHVSFFSQKVDLPSVQMGMIERVTPIMPIPFPSNRLTFEPLSVTFKVDEEIRNWEEVFDWMYISGKLGADEDYESLAQSSGGFTSDITLTVLSNKGNPIGNFVFVGAYPESLSGINFSTTDSATTYPEATVSFRYTYFRFERIMK